MIQIPFWTGTNASLGALTQFSVNVTSAIAPCRRFIHTLPDFCNPMMFPRMFHLPQPHFSLDLFLFWVWVQHCQHYWGWSPLGFGALLFPLFAVGDGALSFSLFTWINIHWSFLVCFCWLVIILQSCKSANQWSVTRPISNTSSPSLTETISCLTLPTLPFCLDWEDPDEGTGPQQQHKRLPTKAPGILVWIQHFKGWFLLGFGALLYLS